MAPAISIDGRRGPPLPAEFRVPERREPEKKSPLPDEWSDGGQAIRQIIEAIGKLIDDDKGSN